MKTMLTQIYIIIYIITIINSLRCHTPSMSMISGGSAAASSCRSCSESCRLVMRLTQTARMKHARKRKMATCECSE